MAFYLIILSFFFTDDLRFNSSVQNPLIEGHIFDKNSQKPVMDASVSIGSVTVNTDRNGKFKIWLPTVSSKDTLKVSTYRYQLVETSLIPYQNSLTKIKIYLIPKPNMLDEVKIFVSPLYKKDSINTREEFKKIFDYDAPKVYEAFNLTSINVSVLYEALSKDKKQKTKLQRLLIENERHKYLTQKISKNRVRNITKLDGKRLDDFYYKFLPSFDSLINATDYEIIKYIKGKYDQEFNVTEDTILN